MAILEPSSRRRKLAAILHADVVGFSRLMGENEAGTHQALGELRRAVDPLIAAHGGRIVGTAGDSLLADFRASSTRSAAPSRCSGPRARSMSRSRRSAVSSCGSGSTLAMSSSMATTFSVMASISPPGSRRSRSPAQCASRKPFTTRSGTSSISITVRSAAHRVKNIAEPVRAYAVGIPAGGASAAQERQAAFSLPLQSLPRRLPAWSPGTFTRALAARFWGSALRPSRSKSRASLPRVVCQSPFGGGAAVQEPVG